MRPLNLHISALNDVEYGLFTSSLRDLALTDDVERPHDVHDDAYYDQMSVGVREVRAWLRGRYSQVPAPDIDSILRLFYPDLAVTDSLSGGQFFAALRLVIHANGGKNVDRALAFVQALPDSGTASRPQSPKVRRLPNLPPTPVRPITAPCHPISALSTGTLPNSDTPSLTPHNPFPTPECSPADPHAHPYPLRRNSSSTPNPQQQNPPQYQTEYSHNPFLPSVNSRVLSSSGTGDVTSSSKLPPLPPRKPPPPIPTQSQPAVLPSPNHASHALPNVAPIPPSKSTAINVPPTISPFAISQPSFASPLIPSPPGKTGTSSHVTSTLMRQSLQASKAAQTMKKAEEQLEKERVLQVLRRSAVPAASSASSPGVAMASRNRSTSPAKLVYLPPPSTGSGSTAYSSGSDERAPPLPRRRTHIQQHPSPPVSSSSLEQVALAGASHSLAQPPVSVPLTSAMTNTASNTSGRANSNNGYGVSASRSPAEGTTVTTTTRTDSPASSPSRVVVDLPPVYSGPPPMHPDRKHTRLPSHSRPSSRHAQMQHTTPSDAESFEMIYGSDTSEPKSASHNADSPTSRLFRSKSMHHPSTPPPVPPPLRRKRPESVQVFGTSVVADPPTSAGVGPGGGGERQASLSRHVSLATPPSGHRREPSLPNSQASSTTHHDHDSPLSNIQRTLATLQPRLDALQPRLDKARYKAEAGLSRRGFVRDGKVGKSDLEVEEEKGLMGWREKAEWDDTDRPVVHDHGGVSVDGGVSERESAGEAQRYAGTNGPDGDEEVVWDQGEGVSVERDNLKWPAGEGWKPL